MDFIRIDLARAAERIIGHGIENDEEANVTATKISEVIWPVIQYYKDRAQEPALTSTALSVAQIQSIVEAATKYKLLPKSSTEDCLVFMYYARENMFISRGCTLAELICQIVLYYSRESYHEGAEHVKQCEGNTSS